MPESWEYPETQAEYDWLVERWFQHRLRPFPCGVAAEEVAGVCLVQLDFAIAGFVESYVGRRQRLGAGGIKVLHLLHNDVRLVLPHLTGDAADYFAELEEMLSTILWLHEVEGCDG